MREQRRKKVRERKSLIIPKGANEKQKVKKNGGWTREEDEGRVRQLLIYSGFLLSGGKGGQTGYPKHRIVHRSRSRWHVT